MSHAIITVTLDVSGDRDDIVDSVTGLRDALYDHFKEDNYLVRLNSYEVTTKNYFKAAPADGGTK